MELVGVENILGGIDPNDPDEVATIDYHADQDWIDGKFLKHGVPIHTVDDIPTVRRLSTFEGDYKRLRQGLATLDFRGGHELVEKNKPLFDPVNLFRSDVRIVVIKKNSTVLQRLVDDLGEIHADLAEIPTLIIDDEADQASVNTKKQKNPTAEEKEQSAINRRPADLLRLLERAQYIGYTATPFANVFVDPDDSQDIFPKDFILSLERPEPYMGARDFHDLDVDFTGIENTIHNSKEETFVRCLYAVDDADKRRAEMQQALDAFVLAGAIKLFRRQPTESRCVTSDYQQWVVVAHSVEQGAHAVGDGAVGDRRHAGPVRHRRVSRRHLDGPAFVGGCDEAALFVAVKRVDEYMFASLMMPNITSTPCARSARAITSLNFTTHHLGPRR